MRTWGHFFPWLALYALALSGCITDHNLVEVPNPIERGERPSPTIQDSYQPTKHQTRFTPTPSPTIGVRVVTGESDGDLPPFKLTEPTAINVDGLPLPAFINETLGNVLGISFVIDPALSDKKDLVTLRITDPEPPAELFKLITQVLDTYGVGLVRQGKIWKVIPVTGSANLNPPLLKSGDALPEVPASHRPVFQVVHLKVIRNTQVAGYLRQLYNMPGLKIMEDADRNAILLLGPPSLVDQAMQAVRFFDQPFMRGYHSMRIDPVFLSAEELAEQLQNVLGREGYAMGASVVIFPIKSSNALIVFCSGRETLAHVRHWARVLDSPGHVKDRKSLFFYPVQHTKAEALAEVINPLFENLVTTPEEGSVTTAKARLVVDKLRNALLFQGNGEDWARLLPILQEMDVPAKQVLIEVIIAELEVTDQESLGVDWLLTGVKLGDKSGSLSSGGTYDMTGTGTARLLINAFATDRRVNVLSSPRILVKSGEEATINVGNDVPILGSRRLASSNEQIDGTSTVLQDIQYRKTGIMLSVRPVVHAGNQIDLEIQQEVSNALTTGSSTIDSPTIQNRTLETKLTLEDGGAVLLGGLMEQQETFVSTGVPGLSRVPIVGHLFRTDDKNTTKSNLIIFIVPYVLTNNREANDITRSIRDQFEQQARDSLRDLPTDRLPRFTKPGDADESPRQP